MMVMIVGVAMMMIPGASDNGDCDDDMLTWQKDSSRQVRLRQLSATASRVLCVYVCSGVT